MRNILAVTCFLFLLQLAYSQSYIPTVTQFNTKDGLSNDKVYAIHKDIRGFIWIGTEEGLNRFDGKDFRVFTPENLEGMTIRTINEIIEDDEGNLWLIKNRDKHKEKPGPSEINVYSIFTGQIILLC